MSTGPLLSPAFPKQVFIFCDYFYLPPPVSPLSSPVLLQHIQLTQLTEMITTLAGSGTAGHKDGKRIGLLLRLSFGNMFQQFNSKANDARYFMLQGIILFFLYFGRAERRGYLSC